MKGTIFTFSTIRERSPFNKIILWIPLLIIAYMLSMFSVQGFSSRYLAISLILVVLLMSYIFWRKAILWLFIWVIFSGAVRKWILPQISDLVFFLNHVILTGVYIGYFAEKLKTKSPLIVKHRVNVFMTFLFFWGLASVFNPRLPSIYIGLLGLMIHFYYIPMIFIIPEIFETKEQLINCFKTFILVSIPSLILGVIQFLSPLDSPINQYVTETDVVPMGNFPRIASTFPFISGYVSYLNILILLVICLLSFRRFPLKTIYFYYLIVGFGVLNLFMTGSRSGMSFTILSVLLYMFISGSFNPVNIRRYFFRVFFAGLALISLALSPLGRNAVDAFMSRFESSDEITTRVSDIYNIPLKYFAESGFYGFGIGSTYQGSYALIRILNISTREWAMPMDFEEEPLRILLEVGLAGFIMVYVLRFLFVKYFWDLYRKLKDEELKNIALICALYVLPIFINVHKLVFDQTAHVFYWFVIGLLFLLPKLDQQIVVSEKAKK